MNIALMNIEPKIHNTALMQISQHHKNNGDQVEWYIDWKRNQYERIYCSSLFDFTIKSQIPNDAICGGSGFDLTTKLPPEIENCDLDYSIYPECRISHIWFSRGCIRNCPFCVVRQKEGYIHSVKPHNLNPNGETIYIQDNNFFANPEWRNAETYLKKWDQPVTFQQGIDIRLFNKEQADFLKKYKAKWVFMAWDNPKENLYPKFKKAIEIFPKGRIICYVLIGYWSTPEEDKERVFKLAEIGIRPYVMPYNKKDKYQRQFARYVNNSVAYFRRMSLEEYLQDQHEKKKYEIYRKQMNIRF